MQTMNIWSGVFKILCFKNFLLLIYISLSISFTISPCILRNNRVLANTQINNLNAKRLTKLWQTSDKLIDTSNPGLGSEMEDSLDSNILDRVIEALEAHKAIYGDLMVHKKFVIPNSDPWPDNIRNFPLGARLSEITTSDTFHRMFPMYSRKMRSLGFNPNGESLYDSWNVLKAACVTYNSLFRNLNVPSNFIVPNETYWPRITHGFKLGLQLGQVKRTGKYIEFDMGRREELVALGFQAVKTLDDDQIRNDKFDVMISALLHYKTKNNGSIEIPESFIVPVDNSWPESTWGLELGKFVSGLTTKPRFEDPDRLRRLEGLGIKWKTSRVRKTDLEFNKLIKGLIAYKNIYGNLLVSDSFIVPPEDPWPLEVQGMKLGSKVAALRSLNPSEIIKNPENVKLLESIGFNWNSDKVDDSPRDEISLEDRKKARMAKLNKRIKKYGFSSLIGSNNKPRTTKTSTDPPEYMNATEKLIYEENLKHANLITLVPMFSDPDQSIIAEWDPTYMYKISSYAHENAYISNSEYRLGRRSKIDPDIRDIADHIHFGEHLDFNNVFLCKFTNEQIAEMKEIGYRILEFGKYKWDYVFRALEAYKRKFGNVDVPYDFIITSDVMRLERCFNFREFRNMPLGEFVEAIRIGDVDGLEDPERRKLLDDLGFNWGDKSKHMRFRFKPLMLGCKIKRFLHRNSFIRNDFIVPSDERGVNWPYWMHGMRLGEMAAICRIQQKMLREHHHHKFEVLSSFDFCWFYPPTGVNPKYFKPVE